MAQGNGETKGPTKRVVLRRERVLVLPEGAEAVDRDKLSEALGISKAATLKLVTGEAWLVVGEFEGHSKTNAIEAHAGKPGTPDAKPGAYKAPGASAWAGGLVYEAPPVPLVERRELD